MFPMLSEFNSVLTHVCPWVYTEFLIGRGQLNAQHSGYLLLVIAPQVTKYASKTILRCKLPAYHPVKCFLSISLWPILPSIICGHSIIGGSWLPDPSNTPLGVCCDVLEEGSWPQFPISSLLVSDLRVGKFSEMSL